MELLKSPIRKKFRLEWQKYLYVTLRLLRCVAAPAQRKLKTKKISYYNESNRCRNFIRKTNQKKHYREQRFYRTQINFSTQRFETECKNKFIVLVPRELNSPRCVKDAPTSTKL